VTVLVPAGLPLLDAARWVGASCWLELAVHERLTEVLASEHLDAEVRVAAWRIRSHRAEVAEAWHRRLPELREMPRSAFVQPPPEEEVAGFDAGAGGLTVDQVVGMLAALDDRYATHERVAVGLADGPVRATLSWARVLLAEDRAALLR
jgi:hypothetical protein